MKLWRLLLLNTMLMGAQISGAQASVPSSTQSIEAIRVSGLPANQTLYVFYATGRSPAMDLDGVPLLRTIKKGPVKVQIDSNGQANLPAITVNRVGFDIANFVIFDVVRPSQSQAYLENPDCTVPSSPSIPNPQNLSPQAFNAISTGYIDIVSLENLKTSPSATSVSLRYGKDIRVAAPQQQSD